MANSSIARPSLLKTQASQLGTTHRYRHIGQKLRDNDGLVFIVKFLVLFLLFFYFNLAFISITSKKDIPLFRFIDLHFNYIGWIRNSLLAVTNFVCNLIGMGTFRRGDFQIRLSDSHKGIRMVYSCIGFGIMSFWAAFVFANDRGNLKTKAIWLVGGIAMIWALNCARMIILLYAIKKSLPFYGHFGQHALFNFASYTMIFLLMWQYLSTVRKALHIKNALVHP